MTLVAASPIFNDAQFLDDAGNPLEGGKIFTYAAGSNSSQQATYTTALGNTQNTNPITLDSDGRMPQGLWLENGNAYNLVLTRADGNTVIRSADNIRGAMPVNAVGAVGTVIWNIVNENPVYISSGQFKMPTNLTTEFAVGNRIQYLFEDNVYGYATVSDVIYSDPDTFVYIIPDDAGFNNTVVAVFYSSATATSNIVDAGGVRYTANIAYSGSSVGHQLQQLQLQINSNNTVYDSVWDGTSTYNVTPLYTPSSYSGSSVKVKFDHTSIGVAVNMNLANLGQTPLKQLSSGGAQVDPVIVVGMISEVAYDGTNLILLNPLPATPAGTVTYFAANTAPAGWLNANGAAVSRTIYSTLYSVVGDTFGSGDGSTTFGIPDLRGQFIRGWDAGRGIDAGRIFGNVQQGQMESHNHRMVWTWYDGGGGRGLVDPVNPVDITYAGQGGGNASWGVTFAGNGTETRPVNMALLPCIKY
jgi:hypothetical protein